MRRYSSARRWRIVSNALGARQRRSAASVSRAASCGWSPRCVDSMKGRSLSHENSRWASSPGSTQDSSSSDVEWACAATSRARRWAAVGTSPISPASRVRRTSADGAQISSLAQPAEPAAAARDRASGLPPANRSTRSRSSGRICAATSRLRACSEENGSSSVTCRSPDQAGSAVHCGCGARRPARTTRVSSAARGRKWCHSQLSSHWQWSNESTNRTVPGTSRNGPAACSKSAGSRLTKRPSSSTSSRPASRAWSARRRSSVDFPMPPGPHT